VGLALCNILAEALLCNEMVMGLVVDCQPGNICYQWCPVLYDVVTSAVKGAI
jgi:hypothetical protein